MDDEPGEGVRARVNPRRRIPRRADGRQLLSMTRLTKTRLTITRLTITRFSREHGASKRGAVRAGADVLVFDNAEEVVRMADDTTRHSCLQFESGLY